MVPLDRRGTPWYTPSVSTVVLEPDIPREVGRMAGRKVDKETGEVLREGLPRGLRVKTVSVQYGGKLPLAVPYSSAEVGASLWADLDLEYGDAEEALAALRGLAQQSVREQLASVKGANTGAAALLAAAPMLGRGQPPEYITVQTQGGEYCTYALADVVSGRDAKREGDEDPGATSLAMLRERRERENRLRVSPLGNVLWELDWGADVAAVLAYQGVTSLLAALEDEDGRDPYTVPEDVETYGLTPSDLSDLQVYLATGMLLAPDTAPTGMPFVRGRYLRSWLEEYENEQERKRQQNEDAVEEALAAAKDAAAADEDPPF